MCRANYLENAMTPHDAQQQAEQLVCDILGPRTRDCDGAYNEYVQLIASALREVEQRVWEEAAKLIEGVAINHQPGFSPMLLEAQMKALRQQAGKEGE